MNGAVLWLSLHWNDLDRWARLTLGSMPGLIAIVLAAFMWRLERFRLEFVALIVVVIATPLLMSVWLHEFDVGRSIVSDYRFEVFVESPEDQDGLNNFQILVVAFVTIMVAAGVMVRTGTTTHSAQAALAALAAYAALLLFQGVKPRVDNYEWAALALRFVPLALICIAVITALLRVPSRRHQATPWMYLTAALLIAIFFAIPLYGPKEWFQVQLHGDVKSYLSLSVFGALLAGCGLVGRKLLAHRGRLPTLMVTLAGLCATLYALRYAAETWPQQWAKASIAGKTIPPPDLAMLGISILMTMLASRVQMMSFLLVGLCGLATSIHVLGRVYFTSDQWWPAMVIAMGVLCFALALVVELRRTRGNALDDLTTRTRL